MFRVSRRSNTLRTLRWLPSLSYASRLSTTSSHSPNTPLALDPSLQAILKDVDLALLKHKTRGQLLRDEAIRELEILPFEASTDVPEIFEGDEDESENGTFQKSRKSAAALFGSQGIGSVYIPFELRTSIERLIEESNKPMLHEDAKRLFLDQNTDDSRSSWRSSTDLQYKSRKQAARHYERDGTAFASVALPAHYSVVYSVLDHVKRRLGENWSVERVIDWGSGTGSALWAVMHSFQRSADGESQSLSNTPMLANSTISTYLGIDKRDGLTTMAKKLIHSADVGRTSLSWQRRYMDSDRIHRTEGGNAVALSAFFLSSMPTPLARKELVKEMWNSGANVIILIDHDSPSGFESIVEAREYLLRMGKREFEDASVAGQAHTGCHVVAPCPHDKACPLRHPGSTQLVCSFSQRMQRPAFLRKTKHVKAGHEDIGYSYVVIRRGPRPTLPHQDDMQAQASVIQSSIKENETDSSASTTASEGDHQARVENVSAIEIENVEPTKEAHGPEKDESEDSLRIQAYRWPRVVFPPIKNSGHVILDSCTPEGEIMRMTIPRSQGKQPYYDARKASWGDMFPHAPKNQPQVRHKPTKAKRSSDTTPAEGADIGKRSKRPREGHMSSYKKLASDMKEMKKQRRGNFQSKRKMESDIEEPDVEYE